MIKNHSPRDETGLFATDPNRERRLRVLGDVTADIHAGPAARSRRKERTTQNSGDRQDLTERGGKTLTRGEFY